MTLIEHLLCVVMRNFVVGAFTSCWVALEIWGSCSLYVKSWINILIQCWVASLFLNWEALKSNDRAERGYGNSLTDLLNQVTWSQVHSMVLRWEISSSQSSLYQVLVRQWLCISRFGWLKDTAVSSCIASWITWTLDFWGCCCLLES